MQSPEHLPLPWLYLYNITLFCICQDLFENFFKNFFDFWKSDILSSDWLFLSFSWLWFYYTHISENVNTFQKEILHKFEMTVYRHKTEMIGTIEPDLSISGVICCAYCINDAAFIYIIPYLNKNDCIIVLVK